MPNFSFFVPDHFCTPETFSDPLTMKPARTEYPTVIPASAETGDCENREMTGCVICEFICKYRAGYCSLPFFNRFFRNSADKCFDKASSGMK